MDPPSLFSLPIELVLLIAEKLPRCRDVLNLMRILRVSNDRGRDTVRRFQKIMFRIDAHMFSQPDDRRPRHIMLLPGSTQTHTETEFDKLHPVIFQVMLTGDVELARLALVEYKAVAESVDKPLQTLLYATRELRTDLLASQPATSPLGFRSPTLGMLAVLSGNIEMLKLVQEVAPQGLSGLRDVIVYGFTVPLHFAVTAADLAAHQGRVDMVRFLVEAGARVNWSPRIQSGEIEVDDRDYYLWMAWEYPDDPGRIPAVVQNPGIFASIWDWGLHLFGSVQQQFGRLDVLQYFLDKGCPIDADVTRAVLGHRPFVPGVCTHSTCQLPGRFTPLWCTLWSFRPCCVALALVLIHRGARWAPWTSWEGAPWGRGGLEPNSSTARRWPMSPFEWVLRGGECTKCAKQDKEPDPARLEIEHNFFITMMEKGIDKPTTPDQLQQALRFVIHAHTSRASWRCPELSDLAKKRARYLIEKGAKPGDLPKGIAKKLRALARLWKLDPSTLAELWST